MNIQTAQASRSGSGRPKLVKVNGRVLAFGELTAGDIVGALPNAKLAELRANLGIAAAPDHVSTDRPGSASQQRLRTVANAIDTDDACKGKAGRALAMLASDDYAGLSARALVKLISKEPTSAVASDPEAGARAEMKAALKGTRNSGIAPGSGAGASADDNGSAGWSKAIAAVNSQQGGR